MNQQTCNQFCTWVRNTQNLDHYTCLKCGKERNLNEVPSNQPPIGLLVLMAIAIGLTVLVQDTKTPQPTPPKLEALSTP